MRSCTEKASVLVVALWGISLLSLLAISAGSYVWAEMQRTALQWDRMKTQRLGLAAVELAKSVLQKDDDAVDSRKDAWRAAPLFQNIALPEGTLTLTLEDEESRINLNTAEVETLSAIPGITPEIAAAIVDWRDSDDRTSAGGAESDFYRALQPPYACGNGDFQSLDELLLVRGVTAEILQTMRPWVTVYGDGRVNINTAPAEILSMLRLDPRIARYRQGDDGIDGTEDDRVFSEVRQILNIPEAQSPSRLPPLAVRSRHFQIHAEIAGRSVTKLEIVIACGLKRKECRIKSWTVL